MHRDAFELAIGCGWPAALTFAHSMREFAVVATRALHAPRVAPARRLGGDDGMVVQVCCNFKPCGTLQPCNCCSKQRVAHAEGMLRS